MEEKENVEINSIPKLFWNTVQDRAGKIAMREKHLGIWQETTWSSYGESAKFTGLALRSLGLEKGDVVSTLAEIGVVLLLFEVGLETNLEEFVELGSTSILVALIGVVAPFALGYGAIYALGLGGDNQFEIALFVGAAMTATSVGLSLIHI